MGLHDQLQELVLHFDDELGVLSAIGSGLAGAGLAALLLAGMPGNADAVVTLAGLGLIVLDYFR